MSSSTVTVSIINYRTGDLTLNCVRSVLECSTEFNGQIVIVDNNSGDGSAGQISDWISTHPDAPVTLIESDSNTGFSGGHNQAMATVESDFYLLLNSDALVKPGFFNAILSAADYHTAAGLFAPRLEGEDGQAQVSLFRFHSPLGELIRSASTGPITRLLQRHDVPLGFTPDPNDIEWASFACILVRGEMVRQIGVMDEGYFLYFEDAEYCLRARRAGWHIVHVPDAIAVHFRGGSGPVKAMEAARKRRPGYYYRSRTRFFRQAHGVPGLILANILWHTGHGIAQLRRLMGHNVPASVERESSDIWSNLNTPLSTRRQVED